VKATTLSVASADDVVIAGQTAIIQLADVALAGESVKIYFGNQSELGSKQLALSDICIEDLGLFQQQTTTTVTANGGILVTTTQVEADEAVLYFASFYDTQSKILYATPLMPLMLNVDVPDDGDGDGDGDSSAGRLNLDPLYLPIGDPQAKQGVTITTNIDYTEGNQSNTNQILNMWVPKGTDEGPYPVVFYIHGGGWISGGAGHGGLGPYATIGENGLGAKIAVVSAGYTLGQDWLNPTSFPENIQDVRCALHYVIKNADLYNLDVSRIMIAGSSSGGHLAALLAYAAIESPMYAGACGDDTLDHRQYVIGMLGFPAVWFYGGSDQSAEYTGILPCNLATCPDMWNWVDPQQHLAGGALSQASDNSNQPPTMIVYGEEDRFDSKSAPRFDNLVEGTQMGHDILGVPAGHTFFGGWSGDVAHDLARYEAVDPFFNYVFGLGATP
jgi:acetyl esterase/lipase